jgi:hypothetical protein
MDAAVAHAAKGLSLFLLLLLAGCAGGEQPRWSYQAAAVSGLAGPAALWGPAETEADAGFLCKGANRLEFWLSSDTPITDGRPVTFRAGRKEDRLTERFDADGFGISTFAIPPGSPLLGAIAQGAQTLEWRMGNGPVSRLPLGRAVRNVALDCIARSAGQSSPSSPSASAG